MSTTPNTGLLAIVFSQANATSNRINAEIYFMLINDRNIDLDQKNEMSIVVINGIYTD